MRSELLLRREESGDLREAGTSNPDRCYKWVIVAIVWLIACLNYTDRMTIFSVLPVLKQQMGFSNIALGLLGSTFLWSYALFSPIGGYLGDHFSRRRVILASLFLFSLVTFATGLARTANQMIFLRCLLGFSEAVFLPPALAYLATYHDDRTRSLANSIALSGLTVGAGFGSWYGGYMSDRYSWRVGFQALGIVGVFVAGMATLVLRKDAITRRSERSDDEPFLQKITGVLQTRSAQALVFLAFALSLTSWPAHSWIPTYMFERFHLTLTKAGSVITWYAALPALLGGIAGGVLADRWSARDLRGRMAVQAIGLSVMAPAMLVLFIMASPRAVTSDLLIYSVARGMLECNSMPIFCGVVRPNNWAMAYGIYNFAGTLAGSLGIFLIGMKKDTWGIAYSLSLMSVLLFMTLAVTIFVMFKHLAKDMQARDAGASPAHPAA